MQQEYTVTRTLPVTAKTQVLVVGAGPAGVCAALEAARHGASATLIEQGGDVGGIATIGLMSHWTGSADSSLYREILARSALHSGSASQEPTTLIDPENLKILLLEMLLEAGVKLRLYTFAYDVVKKDGRLCGVATHSKSGDEIILADIIIDASGDGDMAWKAGVPYTKGRESDGKMQPATLMFKVAGVDEARAVFLGCFEDTYETPKGELQALARKILPPPAGHVLLYRSTLPGVVTCNMTNCVEIDGTQAQDLTRAQVSCRRQLRQILQFLRDYVPGYENCYLISSASLIGIRETRHFKGDYTLTEADIAEARQFNEWVVSDAHFNFDVHNMAGAGLDETGVQKKFRQNRGYTIPYGCLLPQGEDWLLLAGRNISGTHMAHSNYRAMPICAAIGQAAGLAAALAVQMNCPPREFPVSEIQRRLQQEGTGLGKALAFRD